jgi:hypothetical protein
MATCAGPTPSTNPGRRRAGCQPYTIGWDHADRAFHAITAPTAAAPVRSWMLWATARTVTHGQLRFNGLAVWGTSSRREGRPRTHHVTSRRGAGQGTFATTSPAGITVAVADDAVCQSDQQLRPGHVGLVEDTIAGLCFDNAAGLGGAVSVDDRAGARVSLGRRAFSGRSVPVWPNAPGRSARPASADQDSRPVQSGGQDRWRCLACPDVTVSMVCP